MFSNIRTIMKRIKVKDNSCLLNYFLQLFLIILLFETSVIFYAMCPSRSSCDNGAAKNI